MVTAAALSVKAATPGFFLLPPISNPVVIVFSVKKSAPVIVVTERPKLSNSPGFDEGKPSIGTPTFFDNNPFLFWYKKLQSFH